MTPTVDVLPADATVGTARARITATGHSAYPLVDAAGRCIGMVTRGDLLADPDRSETPVVALASTEVVSVTPDLSLLEVLERIVEEGIEHVPVVDPHGRLVGICTRTDVLRGRSEQLVHERPQPGWRMGRAVGGGLARARRNHRDDGRSDQFPDPEHRAS